MAERLFKRALIDRGLEDRFQVGSAGISAMDGDLASENSIDACREVGLDITDHQSSALTRASLQEASVIFCMTEPHRALLNMYFELPPGYPVFLMREFLDLESRELPDPFGQSLEVYQECRDRMIEAMPSLINWVEKNL